MYSFPLEVFYVYICTGCHIFNIYKYIELLDGGEANINKEENIQNIEVEKLDSINKDIRRILMKIQRHNPGVFRRIIRYGVSYPVTVKWVKRIIRLTLIYSEY